MRDILLVFSNPLDGRHEPFNDWYTNVHVRDVMRMPTSIAVQRFRQGSLQPEPGLTTSYAYLALYEVDDTVKCTAAHAVAMTPALPISDSFDLASPASYYRMRGFVSADPLAARDGALILVGFDDAGQFDLTRAAAMTGHHGLLSVAHVEACGDRLIDREPVARHLLLARLSDPAAACAAWESLRLVSRPSFTALFEPLMPRLTADDVLNAAPADKAREDASRTAMGDAQHRFLFADGVVQPA